MRGLAGQIAGLQIVRVSASPIRLSLTLGLAATFVAGCYDHRYTQALIERQRRAKQAEGSEIRAAANTKTAKHDAKLKLYVADDYQKQHPNWKEPLLDLIDQANAVLIPSFGVRLELVHAGPWAAQCGGIDLDQCLDELKEHDAGAPDEWIVGVFGAQSRFTASFDELGRAFRPGRHMVLRDVSDLAEHDAIEQAFASLSQERREEIYKKRKRHKRLAILLHEWGHTLGAEHSTESTSLLRGTRATRGALSGLLCGAAPGVRAADAARSSE